MKIWLIERAETEDVDYDETRGVLVIAESEEQARAMASKERGVEGEAAWLDPSRTTCKELVPGDAPRVVLVDFRAG